MRNKRSVSRLKPADPNMTPMIDVVFLLISFFTLVMNFSQAEQNEEVTLPKSELAQPPDAAPPEMITLQVLADHTIILGNRKCGIENDDLRSTSLSAAIHDELDVLHMLRRVEPRDVAIVVRGDASVDVGFVQKTISVCQDRGADNFILRARQVRE
ncbi:MAG: biopolymer transporter ExbD [Thermoguttaceae bacterium]|nr:biopolymer transporter ExbD [Thermoguttaceae bacterium]